MFGSSFKFQAKDSKRRIQPVNAENESQSGKSFLTIADIPNGRAAKVIKLQGSRALTARLEAMGIIPGTVITRKSSIPGKGPIIIEKGTVQFAVSHEMAQNITIECI